MYIALANLKILHLYLISLPAPLQNIEKYHIHMFMLKQQAIRGWVQVLHSGPGSLFSDIY